MITRWQQQPFSIITTKMKKCLYNRLFCKSGTCGSAAGGMSLSSLHVLVSKTTTQRRFLATSKQKRKWVREQGNNKPFMKKKYASILEKEAAGGTSNIDTKVTSSSSTTNWRPFFFLGVFPMLMSGIVVLSREDLREEVEKKGIGRFLKDLKNWRTLRALEHDKVMLNNNLRHQQHDDHETNNVNNNSNSQRQDEETNNDAR